jgi:hypothetical protein
VVITGKPARIDDICKFFGTTPYATLITSLTDTSNPVSVAGSQYVLKNSALHILLQQLRYMSIKSGSIEMIKVACNLI